MEFKLPGGFLATACAVCVASAPALAVNRCVDTKGRVTYQDAACSAATGERPVDTSDALSSKPVPSAIQAASGRTPQGVEGNPYSSARGTWRGPAQFQLSVGGVRDGSAQMVTRVVIELKASGEVVGVVPQEGCNLSGLATQFVTANLANVDVSLKGCRDARFNTRYSGMLASIPSAKEAKLTLHSISTQLPSRKIQVASLEAVLKR